MHRVQQFTEQQLSMIAVSLENCDGFPTKQQHQFRIVFSEIGELLSVEQIESSLCFDSDTISGIRGGVVGGILSAR